MKRAEIRQLQRAPQSSIDIDIAATRRANLFLHLHLHSAELLCLLVPLLVLLLCPLLQRLPVLDALLQEGVRTGQGLGLLGANADLRALPALFVSLGILGVEYRPTSDIASSADSRNHAILLEYC